MRKRKNKGKASKGKDHATNETDIFSKYAAPISKNFLFFDKLQREFGTHEQHQE